MGKIIQKGSYAVWRKSLKLLAPRARLELATRWLTATLSQGVWSQVGQTWWWEPSELKTRGSESRIIDFRLGGGGSFQRASVADPIFHRISDPSYGPPHQLSAVGLDGHTAALYPMRLAKDGSDFG